MPRKCCVPEYKSNYDSTNEYVTVFKFPSDSDKREAWKKSIMPHKNWSPTKSAVVCRKHFRAGDMVLSDSVTDANGVQCEIPRKKSPSESQCMSVSVFWTASRLLASSTSATVSERSREKRCS